MRPPLVKSHVEIPQFLQLCEIPLFRTPRNAAPGQIVRRKFDRHLIARQNTNEVHPELTGNVGQHLVVVLKLYHKHCVWECFRHNTLGFNYVPVSYTHLDLYYFSLQNTFLRYFGANTTWSRITHFSMGKGHMKHNFLFLINYGPDLFRFLSIALYTICISKSYVLNSACHSFLDVPSFCCSLQLSNRKKQQKGFFDCHLWH